VARLRSRDVSGKTFDTGVLPFYVEKVEDRTRPHLDLSEIARQNHAAAGLARRLLALEGSGPPEERARLLRGARERLAQLSARPCFAAWTAGEPGDDELAAQLSREGFDLLEKLTVVAEEPR
jgi:hypothetical protein